MNKTLTKLKAGRKVIKIAIAFLRVIFALLHQNFECGSGF
jgi:hypothetical protein